MRLLPRHRAEEPLLIRPAVRRVLNHARAVIGGGEFDVKRFAAVTRDDVQIAVGCRLERPRLVVAAMHRPLNDGGDVVEQRTIDVERVPAVAPSAPYSLHAGTRSHLVLPPKPRT